jgi:hypothetical protein
VANIFTITQIDTDTIDVLPVLHATKPADELEDEIETHGTGTDPTIGLLFFIREQERAVKRTTDS